MDEIRLLVDLIHVIGIIPPLFTVNRDVVYGIYLLLLWRNVLLFFNLCFEPITLPPVLHDAEVRLNVLIVGW